MRLTRNLSRRHALAGLAVVALSPLTARAEAPVLRVAKTATCGCCNAWITHMQEAGFRVEAGNMEYEALQQMKAQMGIRPEYASCHTAVIEGYVVEGHVPAGDVRALLDARPAGLGLTVPGMPIGSPGMEMGNEREAYDTLLMAFDGTAKVFRSHR